jgi:hypothetical protein
LFIKSVSVAFYQGCSMKTLIPIFVSVAVILSVVSARSADKEKTPQEIEKLAKELVLKLGHPDFETREAASRELTKLGLAALKAVDEGRRNPEAEIEYRCKSLYSTILRLDLERRLQVLVDDKEGRLENTFPLGVTFEKICGKDENARKFYIELYMDNLQLLDYAVNNPKTIGEDFNGITREIEKNGKGAFSAKTEGAALLLIAADEKIGPSILEANRKQLKGGDRNYERFISLLWKPKYEALMMDPNNGPYFRKLLFAWAKRVPEPLAMTCFMFFIKDMISKKIMNLESGSDTLEFLMDFAASTSPERRPYQKAEAMSLVVGASISKNDRIAFFEEKLFKDETVLPQIFFKVDNTKKLKYDARACDYALAICVKLSGQSMQDYGFDILNPQSDTSDNGWKYGGPMPDETLRAAFKKYAEWRKANPIMKSDPKRVTSK